MITTTDITPPQDLVELDERESNGIRVTLVWDRTSNTASVLTYDERSEQSFTIEVEADDDAYDIFDHPFAYAAFRDIDIAAPVELEAALVA